MISRAARFGRRGGIKDKPSHQLPTTHVLLIVSLILNVIFLWFFIDARYLNEKDETDVNFFGNTRNMAILRNPADLGPSHDDTDRERINFLTPKSSNRDLSESTDTLTSNSHSHSHSNSNLNIDRSNSNSNSNSNAKLHRNDGKFFTKTVLPLNMPENSNPNPPLPNDDFMELSKNHRPYHTITETEMNLWFHNKLFVFEDASYKAAFCVIEKNSCTMFKQIFKRIRGKSDYLSTDYTRIHWLPYRGLEDISFYDMNNILRVMNDFDFYFAAFVRDPLERLVSGYVDKCEKKRGVNLCDYVRWSPIFKAKYGQNKHYNDVGRSWTPDFYMWADGLILCPCWPETDKHFAPQSNFCNLYQYVDRYDIFRFENRTHRKLWMERAGFWDQFGKSGWGSGGDGSSIVNYGPQSHSSTNKDRVASKYVKYYEQNSTVTALLINKYRIDYITFGIQMQDWICDPAIKKTPILKAALRSLPRHTRPPCKDLKWLWIPE